MKSRRMAWSLLGTALLVFYQAGPARPADETAAQVVGRFQKGLLDFLAKGRAPGDAQRFQRLVSLVAQTHDQGALARAQLRGGWKGLDGKQRARIAGAFGRLWAAVYANRLGEFQSFAPPKASHAGLVVESALVRAEGKPVPLEYRLLRVKGQVRIAGAAVSGKPLVLERVEYRTALAEGGVAALVALLEDEVACHGAATPTDVVACLQGAVLEVMKQADQLGYQGRFARFGPVIDLTHDLPILARLSVSRYWKKLGEKRQRRFVATFRRLSVATYASRFDGYKGETFSRTGERQQKRGIMLVQSRFTKSDGGKVHFDYQLRRVGKRWVILNITVDGVSDLATKRAEYGHIMATDGFEALIAKLEDQIRRYAAGDNDD